MAVTAEAKRHAAKIVKRLKVEYPQAECALTHRTPLRVDDCDNSLCPVYRCAGEYRYQRSIQKVPVS